MLAETDANGTTQAAYTQTPDTYGALISQRRSNASSFFDFDALGSTMELTDASQAITDTWRYEAFGETKARTGTTANPFGFVGELGYYEEAALGLHYVRARWYEAGRGRWVSTDPAERFAEYGYVAN